MNKLVIGAFALSTNASLITGNNIMTIDSLPSNFNATYDFFVYVGGSVVPCICVGGSKVIRANAAVPAGTLFGVFVAGIE